MRYWLLLLILTMPFYSNNTPIAKAVDSTGTAVNAQADFNSSLQQFRQTRSRLQQIREKIGEGADESANTEYFIARQKHLQQIAQVMVNYLAALKQKSQSMSYVDEQAKTNVVNQLDSDIQKINLALSKIQTAQNKDELYAAARDLRSNWQNARLSSRRIVGQLLSERLNYISTRLDEALASAEKNLNTIKSNNKDTTRASSLLESAKTKLSSAKAKIQEAKSKFQSINNHTDAAALFKQGLDLVKEARLLLFDAHSDIIKLNAEIRRLSPSVTATP